SADIETIWNKLTPQERAEFQQKFIGGNPENFLELIDELPLWKPWWENTSDKIIEVLPQVMERETQLSESFQIKLKDSSSQRPQILSNIKRIEELTKKSPNPALALNLINILYVYAYISRIFNGSIHENVQDSINILWELSPILNATENVVFQSVDEAIMASYIIILQNPKYMQPPEFQSLILGDIICLLKSIDSVLAAFSDLYRLFQSQQQTAQKSTIKNSTYINSLPQQDVTVLKILRHEVEAERERYIKEGQEYKNDKKKIEVVFENKLYSKDKSEIDNNNKNRLITEI
ncbi:6986_t:CDS:2, partial [Scutellospora calospora]